MSDIETPARTPKGAKGKKGKRGAAKGAGKGAAAASADDKSARRAERQKRLAQNNTVTVLLETPVRKAIAAEAKAAGMDISPYLVKLIEDHVLAAAPAGDPLATRIAAKRAVLERVVETARRSAEAGEFDEHFVLTVIRKAATEPGFRAQYEAAVEADSAGDRALARAQAPINQQMGRLIKRAAGARSKRDAAGKIMRGHVQGELISSYTLLERG